LVCRVGREIGRLWGPKKHGTKRDSFRNRAVKEERKVTGVADEACAHHLAN
jgi:hypothetical protein